MIEVYPRLFVGGDQDYLSVKDEPGWYFLQCARDPYHRQALGYTGRSAPKEHPEYLYAYRGNHLILNIVDAHNPKYFPHEMIREALCFLNGIYRNYRILAHCNKGESRAPSLALLWLCGNWLAPPDTFEEAEEQFRTLYPPYDPGEGIFQYLEWNWERYRER